jgi:hypothetical protein
MGELELDLFASAEPDIEVSVETLRLLDERGADNSPLIPAAEARERILKRLLKLSIGPTR